jgi:hypothetical protein
LIFDLQQLLSEIFFHSKNCLLIFLQSFSD